MSKMIKSIKEEFNKLDEKYWHTIANITGSFERELKNFPCLKDIFIYLMYETINKNEERYRAYKMMIENEHSEEDLIQIVEQVQYIMLSCDEKIKNLKNEYYNIVNSNQKKYEKPLRLIELWFLILDPDTQENTYRDIIVNQKNNKKAS